MRGEKCGQEIDGDGSLCANCAVEMPPVVQGMAAPGCAQELINVGWICAMLSIVTVFMVTPIVMPVGTLTALRVAAVVIAVGLVCAVGGTILAFRAPGSGNRLSAVACIVVLLGCSAAGLAFYNAYVWERHPRSHRSLNNIKQLAMATRTYSEDYGGMLPGWVRNPDGRYAHNTWDEQINGQVKIKDAFNTGDTGIRSYSQTGEHDRILSYGLNGLLITPPKAQFDGNSDFASVTAFNPPKPHRFRDLRDSAHTILFAELSTVRPMPGLYGRPPDPKPFAFSGSGGSADWQSAFDGWIDISPRAFIEIARDRDNNPYADPFGKNADSGIARDLYGGGGVYAFCDGHAKFMKVGVSVGIGTTTKEGLVITEKNCWSPKNTNNMWYPR